MGRLYTVDFATQTITNGNGAVDWFYINAATDKPCLIRGFHLSQITEVGDAQEENLRFRVLRLDSSLGGSSGGTTPTPIPMNDADSAAGFTAHAGDTTEATATNTKVLHDFSWNERNTPYEFWYPDRDFCPRGRNNFILVLRQETSVADNMDAYGTMWVEEL